MKYYRLRHRLKWTKLFQYPFYRFHRLEVDGIGMRLSIFSKFTGARQTFIDGSKYIYIGEKDWPVTVMKLARNSKLEEVNGELAGMLPGSK